jgi:N-acetylneuraminic acid mutarotase
MTRFRVPVFLLVSCLAAVFLYCTKQSVSLGGSGSEVVGTLVDKSGKPVKGAYVRLDTAVIGDSAAVPDTSAIHRGTDTTDGAGNFFIPIPPQFNGGTYNLACTSEVNGISLVGFVANVKNDRPKDWKGVYPIDLHKVPMLAPGTIAGKAVLGSSASAMVFCYIPGTSFLAVADPGTGAFVISGVPQADNYKVYFYAQGYTPVIDSLVNVVSGQQTTLSNILLNLDPSAPLPAPSGFTATADTASGLVKLTWSAVHVSDLAGYVVGTMDSAIPGVVHLDTVSDTNFVDYVYRNSFDSAEHSYSYKVGALDSSGNAVNFTTLLRVHTLPPYYVRTVFKIAAIGGSGDTISAGDSAKIAAFFFSQLTKTISVIWFARTPDSAFIRKTAFDTTQGTDTLACTWNVSGPQKLFVDALDERGNVWSDSATVFVRPPSVSVTAVVSTDSSVTVLWRQSQDPGFAEYRVCAADTASGAAFAVVAHKTPAADTTYTVLTRKNGAARYEVIVASTSGLLSLAGKSAAGSIKNMPPRFATDTASIPKTANVGVQYVQILSAMDVNGDKMTFRQVSSISSLSIIGDSVIWIPTVLDTGKKHIVVQVSDGFGGVDTVAWNVTVTPKNVWSYSASLSKPRRLLSAAAVNGIIYAIGGEASKSIATGATITPYAAVETYAAGSNGSWTLASPLPSARYWMGCAAVNNKIYTFGGESDHGYFNVVDSLGGPGGAWGQAGQLPVYRYNAAACAVGNTVYLIGGMVYNGTDFEASSEINAWDPVTGMWTLKTSMKLQRSDHQAVALNGKIYIIGGVGGAQSSGDNMPLQSVEVYDPSTNSMDTAASLNHARWSFAAAEANGRIYAIGGLFTTDLSDTAHASVEEFDPVQNAWTARQNMPNGRYGCAAVSWGTLIYVLGGVEGGSGGNRETSSVLVFYP